MEFYLIEDTPSVEKLPTVKIFYKNHIFGIDVFDNINYVQIDIHV